MLDEMEKRGMEPNATLWHFTHPIWFEDLGAFEKEENLRHFVDYAEKVFEEFGPRIKLWATLNEPTVC
jgi:beta-glucosidase